MRMTEFKKQRFLKGIKQVELMEMTGISNTYISWIENGYMKPKTEEKMKLAKAMKIPVNELFPEDR